MKQKGWYDICKVAGKPHLLRDKNEEFYFMMFLKTEVPFFYQYDKQSVANISRFMSYHRFEPGQTIFEEGDPASDIWLVLNGEVSLSSKSSLVCYMRDYDVFGDKALIQGSTVRLLTAKASKLSDCVAFGYQEFRDMVYLFELI